MSLFRASLRPFFLKIPFLLFFVVLYSQSYLLRQTEENVDFIIVFLAKIYHVNFIYYLCELNFKNAIFLTAIFVVKINKKRENIFTW